MGPLLTERVNSSGLRQTFIGIIRLWKLDNVVIPQQAVVNTGTQMSSQREELSRNEHFGSSFVALCSKLHQRGEFG